MTSGDSAQTKADWFDRTCAVEDCTRPANALDRECRLHSMLGHAKWLTAKDLETVRQELAGLTVYTDEERAELKRSSHLWTIRFEADRKARSINRARAAGCTDEQIDQAIAEGVATA